MFKPMLRAMLVNIIVHCVVSIIAEYDNNNLHIEYQTWGINKSKFELPALILFDIY